MSVNMSSSGMSISLNCSARLLLLIVVLSPRSADDPLDPLYDRQLLLLLALLVLHTQYLPDQTTRLRHWALPLGSQLLFQ